MKVLAVSSLVSIASAIITKDDTAVLGADFDNQFGTVDFTKEIVEELSPVFDASVNVTALPDTGSQAVDGTPEVAPAEKEISTEAPAVIETSHSATVEVLASAESTGFLQKVTDVTAEAVPELAGVMDIVVDSPTLTIETPEGTQVISDSSFLQTHATPTIVSTPVDSKFMDPIQTPTWRMTMGVLSASGLPELEGNQDYSDVFLKLAIKDENGSDLAAFGSRVNAVDGNAKYQPLNFDDNYIELRAGEELPKGLRLYVEVWDRDGSASLDDKIGVAKVTTGQQCRGVPYEDFMKLGSPENITLKNWTKFDSSVTASNQSVGPVTTTAYVYEVDIVQTCERDIPLATKAGKLKLFARADIGVPKGQSLPTTSTTTPAAQVVNGTVAAATVVVEDPINFYFEGASEVSVGVAAIVLGASMLRM